ncbi:MAG: hypothetical protein H8E34_04060 [Bacteroidetes bacterium]|nr:hypothetical protein [Bacteroidota bacterium]MBL6943209.1 hypothetical protein [Bacteroidales bacterium]
MDNKSGFFDDDNGNKSSTRLVTFLSALTALFLAVAGVFIDEVTLSESLPIIITLLSYSAGAKSFQLFIKSKYSSQ